MKLWRIAAETRAFPADDLGGMGAASHPGRWNDHGEVVVYCATSISLAVLETAAHIDDGGFPQNRFLVEIDVPGGVWSRREEVQASALPAAWSAIPAGRASVRFGSGWLLSRRSPILLVPSVIVPEENCALINPAHPLARQVRARVVRGFEYARMFRAGKPRLSTRHGAL